MRPGHQGIRGAASGLMALWMVMPLVPLLVWSVARGWYFPGLLPQQWSLQAWRYVVSDTSGVLPVLADSILISAAVTAFATLIGVPAGQALGLHVFRGKTVVQMLLLAPVVVPGFAIVLGLHVLFLKWGLVGTRIGVILAQLGPSLPYMVFVMAGIFATAGDEPERQARSLGASAWQSFWHVTLPAIWPGIVTGALFTFLVSWSQYLLPLVIGSGRVMTLPLLLYNFVSAGRSDIAGAIAIIYMLPGLLIILAVSRYLTGRNLAVAGLIRP